MIRAQALHSQIAATRRAATIGRKRRNTEPMLIPDCRGKERARELRRFRWSYFVTLTFRFPVDEGDAWLAVLDWLAPLGPGVYAAVAVERAPARTGKPGQEGWAEGRVHIHALLGGLRRRVDTILTLRRSWWGKHGQALIRLYRGRGGAAWYLCKDGGAVELLGTPLQYRPRRRRCRV